jgi:hypothetical protein
MYVTPTLFKEFHFFVFSFAGTALLPPPPISLYDDMYQADVCGACRSQQLLQRVTRTPSHISPATKNPKSNVFHRHIARLLEENPDTPVCGMVIDDFVD